MRNVRPLIAALTVLQLLLAFTVAGYTFIVQRSFSSMVQWQEMANVRTMMRRSADALALQRDSLARVGAHLPEYGDSLAQCAQLLESISPAVFSFHRLLSVNSPLVMMLGRNFTEQLKQLQPLSEELARTSASLSRDMHYTAGIMRDWTPQRNEEFISALDALVVSMRVGADMLEEQWRSIHRITAAVSAVGYLLAGAIAAGAFQGVLHRRYGSAAKGE